MSFIPILPRTRGKPSKENVAAEISPTASSLNISLAKRYTRKTAPTPSSAPGILQPKEF